MIVTIMLELTREAIPRLFLIEEVDLLLRHPQK